MSVWPVVDLSWGDAVAHLSVTVIVHYRAYRTVDWKFLPVDAETGELCIEVGEVPALQKRIVGEANTCKR